MPDIEGLLNRWLSAGVLEAEAADRIRAWEAEQKRRPRLGLAAPAQTGRIAGIRWQGIVALVLGGILLATGVVLFVSAHWDELSRGGRFALVLALVAVFHLAGAIARDRYRALSTVLHAVGTISTGAAIALVGQIFNIEEHWPAAILLWAIAAFAGWVLLLDQAQQSLTLLLFPAWIFCELEFYTHQHIGQETYLGRFLLVWAIFYFTMFLGSTRRVAHGILFTAASIAAVAGAILMTMGWPSGSSTQTFIPFGVRFWAWAAIAVLPLAIAAFKGHWGLIPLAAAIVFAILLPWCQHWSTSKFDYGSFTRSDPNLAAHALVAAFAVFLIWWGLRQASRALVNLGIVYFGLAVAWFYFSNIFDKVGRSLGLIGLGVIFLAGGWALEKMRRRLLARMETAQEAQ
ncbi:MAG TPA: DUF2157 domain-containing protein [Terracidiphilus sp.]|nr:DUF2157 domain-containing protein [Terracidiphilus sp.]